MLAIGRARQALSIPNVFSGQSRSAFAAAPQFTINAIVGAGKAGPLPAVISKRARACFRMSHRSVIRALGAPGAQARELDDIHPRFELREIIEGPIRRRADQ